MEDVIGSWGRPPPPAVQSNRWCAPLLQTGCWQSQHSACDLQPRQQRAHSANWVPWVRLSPKRSRLIKLLHQTFVSVSLNHSCYTSAASNLLVLCEEYKFCMFLLRNFLHYSVTSSSSSCLTFRTILLLSQGCGVKNLFWGHKLNRNFHLHVGLSVFPFPFVTFVYVFLGILCPCTMATCRLRFKCHYAVNYVTCNLILNSVQ